MFNSRLSCIELNRTLFILIKNVYKMKGRTLIKEKAIDKTYIIIHNISYVFVFLMTGLFSFSFSLSKPFIKKFYYKFKNLMKSVLVLKMKFGN